jgi:folate-binding protein YgfZ
MANFSQLPTRHIIQITGTEAKPFLQSLVSVDVIKIAESTAVYGLLLTPQGKILHDMFILSVNDALLIDVEANQAEMLLKRLHLYKLKRDVVLQIAKDWRVAVMFGESNKKMSLENAIVVDDPRLKALGKRIYASQNIHAEAIGAAEKAAEDYEVFCTHLGVPNGADIAADSYFAFDFDMDDLHAIDYTKGCYVGQEVTARMHYRGVPKKGVYQISAMDDLLPESGTEISCTGKAAGVCIRTIGTQGIAVLRHEFAAGALFADSIAIHATRPKWAKSISHFSHDSV